VTIASLIVDVAANQAMLTRDVDQINSKLDTIGSVAKKMGTALAGAFTIGAVTSFAKGIADTASEIHDMAEKIGISTDAVQGFKFAAEQSGSSLDAVGNAITKMNKNLVGGEKSTVAALKEIGLNFTDIRNMRPEDAFLAIADAIQRTPDPMIQSHAALTLFGKSAAELLPGMKEGFRGVAESVDKMSEDTINNLEAAQDAWEKLFNKVTIVSGNLIGLSINIGKQMTSSWKGFLMFADNALKFGVGAAGAMADTTEKATLAIEKSDHANQNAAIAMTAHAAAHVKLRDAVRETVAISAEEQHIIDLVAIAHGHQVAALKLEEAQYRASQVAVENYIKHLPTANVQLLEGVKNYSAIVPLIGEAADETGNLTRVQVANTQATKNWAAALNNAIVTVGDSIVQAFRGGGFMNGLKDLGNQAAEGVIQGLLTYVPLVGPALSQFAKPILDGIKAIGSAIASVFDRNKGRDLVVEFADSLGGFDALHVKLLTLGDAGEQLWIRLTQGVGRNNPDQARAAIEAINAAFQNQIASVDSLAGALGSLDGALSGRGGGRDSGEAPEGFASGTPNLDFRSFGSRRRVDLHGDEAVIPRQGGASTLASQIASALKGVMGGGDSHFYIDGKEIKAIVKQMAASGQLRTVAAPGRSS
jgi:hypothetical protein